MVKTANRTMFSHHRTHSHRMCRHRTVERPSKNGVSFNKMASNTVCNSLEDAIIHEMYHAKTAYNITFAKYSALNEEDGLVGISKTAEKDLLEALAEMGVLKERGEYDKILSEKIEKYLSYILRSSIYDKC